jgi:hypothetical protein
MESSFSLRNLEKSRRQLRDKKRAKVFEIAWMLESQTKNTASVHGINN